MISPIIMCSWVKVRIIIRKMIKSTRFLCRRTHSDFLKDNRGTSYTNITNKRYLNINNLESVSGFIGEEKIYFIYVDYTVYLISSKTGALFSDLDQIAQSFRYTP